MRGSGWQASDDADVFVSERDGEYVARDSEKELDRGDNGESVLQSAIDACQPGGIIRGDASLPVTGSSITIGDGKTLTGELTLENRLPAHPCLLVEGTHEDTLELRTDASRGDNTIEIKDASVFSSGDTVILERDEEFFSGSRGNKGEIHDIKAVDESTGEVSFYQPLYFNYPVDDAARAEHIAPSSARIKEISIVGTGSENDQHGIWIRRSRDSEVSNVEIDRCGQRAVLVAESYNVHVRESTITRSNRPGIGYGVAFSNGVAHCTVSGSEIRECRHCVAHDSGPSWFGAPRDTTITNNYFVSGKEQPIDAHPNVISTKWTENEVHTHTQAFLTGALETEIIDNVAYGGNALADRGNNANVALVVEGNEFVDSGRFHLYNFSSVHDLQLTDNKLETSDINPIYVEVESGYVTILNNNITYTGSAGSEADSAIRFTRELRNRRIEENDIEGPWNEVLESPAGAEGTIANNSLKSN